ncbi:MAG: RsmD family RNA methyltransferase [Candidatus Kariarchaeaceae archaeon]|jgi:tRNA G10  N-methylase Trm11
MDWLLSLFDIHPNLIHEEMRTLFDESEIRYFTSNLLTVSANETKISEILNLSASIKFILINPLLIKTEYLVFEEKLNEFTPYSDIRNIPQNSEFLARFYQIKGSAYKSKTGKIERNLGSWILSRLPQLTVDLQRPKLKFYAVSWGEQSFVGWVYGENKYAQISWREPKKSPYFRGGGMKPRLCKLLVNLLYPFDPIILDPFCGHGGILREIAESGNFALGIEVSKKVARELKENNRYFGYDDRIAIIIGDSLKQPLRRHAVNMAVTDPPYAIQTTTIGMDREILVSMWLSRQEIPMKIVLTTPTSMLNKLPKGWRMDFEGDDYVHKSMTRRARRIIRV